MTHEEIYLKKRKTALRKKEAGEQLKPSEEVALSGSWFFTVPLPIEIIDRIIDMARLANVKPSDIVASWVYKEMGREVDAKS